jgi:hypothetical protein
MPEKCLAVETATIRTKSAFADSEKSGTFCNLRRQVLLL